MKRILIMGLPGSGKTFLAKILKKKLNADWINADKIRKKFNDWDFSYEGIIRQSHRMYNISLKSKKKYLIADFICPFKKTRKIFKANFIIWMNTIKKGRFKNMNKIFEIPKKVNYEIKDFDSKPHAIIIKDIIEPYKWNNKTPTALMMGRFQPFHDGHLKLFEKILIKNEQVLIFIKDVHKIGDNPFSYQEIKNEIKKKLIKLYKNRFKILKAPNINNICYGRTVGYSFKYIKLPPKIRKISATQIRKKLRKSGKL
jgi:cytidyltransferase-like protein